MAKQLSDNHKAALEAGRVAGRAVKSYLSYLESQSSRRSLRSKQKIEADLSAIEAEIDGSGPVRRISLIQRRLDLQAELSLLGEEENAAALEAAFIEHVADYSVRKGISYKAWREFGVPVGVLRAGGLSG